MATQPPQSMVASSWRPLPVSWLMLLLYRIDLVQAHIISPSTCITYLKAFCHVAGRTSELLASDGVAG
jgi:hypothetical protein